jgi:hypothetical protein
MPLINRGQSLYARQATAEEDANESYAPAVTLVNADGEAVVSAPTSAAVKWAVIDHATSGNNTIVAAVTGKKIRVLQVVLISAGTVNARFESGADGTALTGQMNLIVNSGFTLPYSPIGWFETAAATLLNLELSAAVSVDGVIAYIEV